MSKSFFARSANLFMIGGIIVLLVSGLGISEMIKQNGSKIEKEAFRYYLKVSPTSISTPEYPFAPSVTEIPGETSTNPVNYLLLEPSTEFINSNFRPELSQPNIPTRIVIEKIKLDAPIIVPDFNYTNVDGETFGQWQAPSEYAAGWHPDSALLGESGNTVINGHHNAFGEVFGKLVDLVPGDMISVYSGEKEFQFIIANRMILPERFMDTKTRLENARWLARSNDVRLTLVTCWPQETNTHRLILVARPIVAK